MGAKRPKSLVIQKNNSSVFFLSLVFYNQHENILFITIKGNLKQNLVNFFLKLNKKILRMETLEASINPID